MTSYYPPADGGADGPAMNPRSKRKGRAPGQAGFADDRQAGSAPERHCDHDCGRIYESRNYPRCTNCGGTVFPWVS